MKCSRSVASRIRIVLAIVLAAAALNTTVRRLDQFSNSYDSYDFVFFLGWGLEYRTGQEVWTQSNAGEVRPGLPRHFCNYPPPFVEAFAPLTLLDQKLAHWIWQISQLVFLVLALLLLAIEVEPPLDAATVVIFVSLALMFKSVLMVITSGQFGPLLLVLLVISWICARRDRPAIAGLSLAAATLLKLYPGALAIYFIVRRRWDVLWWAAGIFVAGVIASGIDNWRKLFVSGIGHTLYPIAHTTMNRVALLPNVYMMLSTFANGETPSWTAVIAVTAILDLATVAALVWATSRVGNDSVSDGMVFGLWLIATLLLSPLAWRHELVFLFPMFLFAYVAAMRILSEDRSFAGTGFAAGAILIAICASVELIHALPDLRPQMLTALLSLIGTMLILKSWIAAEPSMRSALAASRNTTATNQSQ